MFSRSTMVQREYSNTREIARTAKGRSNLICFTIFSSGFEIPVEEPSPRNMLSFRIGPRVRFGRDTFADSAKKTRQDMPTPETFDLALDKAVEIETERAFVASSGTDTEEEASGQEGPTMPKAIRKKAGQRKAAKPRRPKKKPSIESEQDILEALGVGASSQQFVDDPDEDDLLQSEDESVGFVQLDQRLHP